MTPQELNQLISSVALNFGFKIEGPGSDKWCEVLFETASKFHPEDIIYGVKEMFKMTNKQWSEEYKIPFGKPPAIGVWIEFFQLRQEHEMIAKRNKQIELAKFNAKRGINTRKAVEFKNSVGEKQIKETINALPAYEN